MPGERHRGVTHLLKWKSELNVGLDVYSCLHHQFTGTGSHADPFPASCWICPSRPHFLRFFVVRDDQKEAGRKAKSNQVNALKHNDNNHFGESHGRPCSPGPKGCVKLELSYRKQQVTAQFHNFSSTLSTIRQGQTLIWLLTQMFHSFLSTPY